MKAKIFSILWWSLTHPVALIYTVCKLLFSIVLLFGITLSVFDLKFDWLEQGKSVLLSEVFNNNTASLLTDFNQDLLVAKGKEQEPSTLYSNGSTFSYDEKERLKQATNYHYPYEHSYTLIDPLESHDLLNVNKQSVFGSYQGGFAGSLNYQNFDDQAYEYLEQINEFLVNNPHLQDDPYYQALIKAQVAQIYFNSTLLPSNMSANIGLANVIADLEDQDLVLDNIMSNNNQDNNKSLEPKSLNNNNANFVNYDDGALKNNNNFHLIESHDLVVNQDNQDHAQINALDKSSLSNSLSMATNKEHSSSIFLSNNACDSNNNSVFSAKEVEEEEEEEESTKSALIFNKKEDNQALLIKNQKTNHDPLAKENKALKTNFTVTPASSLTKGATNTKNNTLASKEQTDSKEILRAQGLLSSKKQLVTSVSYAYPMDFSSNNKDLSYLHELDQELLLQEAALYSIDDLQKHNIALDDPNKHLSSHDYQIIDEVLATIDELREKTGLVDYDTVKMLCQSYLPDPYGTLLLQNVALDHMLSLLQTKLTLQKEELALIKNTKGKDELAQDKSQSHDLSFNNDSLNYQKLNFSLTKIVSDEISCYQETDDNLLYASLDSPKISYNYHERLGSFLREQKQDNNGSYLNDNTTQGSLLNNNPYDHKIITNNDLDNNSSDIKATLHQDASTLNELTNTENSKTTNLTAVYPTVLSNKGIFGLYHYPKRATITQDALVPYIRSYEKAHGSTYEQCLKLLGHWPDIKALLKSEIEQGSHEGLSYVSLGIIKRNNMLNAKRYWSDPLHISSTLLSMVNYINERRLGLIALKDRHHIGTLKELYVMSINSPGTLWCSPNHMLTYEQFIKRKNAHHKEANQALALNDDTYDKYHDMTLITKPKPYQDIKSSHIQISNKSQDKNIPIELLGRTFNNNEEAAYYLNQALGISTAYQNHYSNFNNSKDYEHNHHGKKALMDNSPTALRSDLSLNNSDKVFTYDPQNLSEALAKQVLLANHSYELMSLVYDNLSDYQKDILSSCQPWLINQKLLALDKERAFSMVIKNLSLLISLNILSPKEAYALSHNERPYMLKDYDLVAFAIVCQIKAQAYKKQDGQYTKEQLSELSLLKQAMYYSQWPLVQDSVEPDFAKNYSYIRLKYGFKGQIVSPLSFLTNANKRAIPKNNKFALKQSKLPYQDMSINHFDESIANKSNDFAPLVVKANYENEPFNDTKHTYAHVEALFSHAKGKIDKEQDSTQDSIYPSLSSNNSAFSKDISSINLNIASLAQNLASYEGSCAQENWVNKKSHLGQKEIPMATFKAIENFNAPKISSKNMAYQLLEPQTPNNLKAKGTYFLPSNFQKNIDDNNDYLDAFNTLNDLNQSYQDINQAYKNRDIKGTQEALINATNKLFHKNNLPLKEPSTMLNQGAKNMHIEHDLLTYPNVNQSLPKLRVSADRTVSTSLNHNLYQKEEVYQGKMTISNSAMTTVNNQNSYQKEAMTKRNFSPLAYQQQRATQDDFDEGLISNFTMDDDWVDEDGGVIHIDYQEYVYLMTKGQNTLNNQDPYYQSALSNNDNSPYGMNMRADLNARGSINREHQNHGTYNKVAPNFNQTNNPISCQQGNSCHYGNVHKNNSQPSCVNNYSNYHNELANGDIYGNSLKELQANVSNNGNKTRASDVSSCHDLPKIYYDDNATCVQNLDTQHHGAKLNSQGTPSLQANDNKMRQKFAYEQEQLSKKRSDERTDILWQPKNLSDIRRNRILANSSSLEKRLSRTMQMDQYLSKLDEVNLSSLDKISPDLNSKGNDGSYRPNGKFANAKPLNEVTQRQGEPLDINKTPVLDDYYVDDEQNSPSKQDYQLYVEMLNREQALK